MEGALIVSLSPRSVSSVMRRAEKWNRGELYGVSPVVGWRLEVGSLMGRWVEGEREEESTVSSAMNRVACLS